MDQHRIGMLSILPSAKLVSDDCIGKSLVQVFISDDADAYLTQKTIDSTKNSQSFMLGVLSKQDRIECNNHKCATFDSFPVSPYVCRS